MFNVSKLYKKALFSRRARTAILLSLALLLLFSFVGAASAGKPSGGAKESLSVSSLGSDSTADPGATGVILNTIDLAASAGNGITVSEFSISYYYSVAADPTPTFRLWIDNGDGVFDPITDTPKDNPTQTANRFTYSKINLSIGPSSSQRLFYTMNIPSSATPEATCYSYISNGDVLVAKPDVVAPFPSSPYNGPTVTVANPVSADTLSVTHTVPANFNTTQGATNKVLDRLSLTASAGDGTIVTSIRIDEIGSSTDSDIINVILADDLDNDGVVDVGEALQTRALSSGAATFTPTGGIAISPGASKNLLIAVDISNMATVGATIRTNIADHSYITVASPDTVATLTTYSSATVSISDKPDTLTISQTLVPSGSAVRSSDDNLIQVLNLSVNEDRTTISSLRINRAGTALDSDTKANGVKLWLDNGDNLFNPAADTMISSGSFVSGVVNFILSTPVEVAPFSAKKLFITYSISTNAIVGSTIGAQITDASSVVVSTPDTVSLSVSPLSSNMQTIVESVDTLTVSHTPSADATTTPGSTDKVIDNLILSAPSGDGITVTSIKVDEAGTATDNDVSVVKLIEDANRNGVYEAGIDILLDARTFVAGSTTFPKVIPIDAGTTKNLLIAVDIASTAMSGAIVQTNIANGTYIVVSAPDMVSMTNFPLTSGMLIIGI